ncbi:MULTISPECIES: AEC family transporter [unclassified Mitsuokella]|uniref:AEC family transporter n=1 Tax=unclassified Mitsuokella TaxID=2637239 RepID=UPI000E53944A|nr:MULTISPECIES: AEC family transporter [unclassified Mitsuokella]RGS74132.1 AEC family transporter [Mitsuokella sp. AF21-1AC]RHM57167.1 AEC family transporter [Mitsuokella sp. AF33-22]
MVSNLLVAIGAVVPMFCLMFIGAMVKRMKLLTDEELVHVNRMVFRIFFFCMMFYNIYTTDIATTFRPNLILFGAGGVLATALIAGIIVCAIEPSNKRRGAMIQATFRSNFVLMGIPLIANIFGDDQLAIPTMMIAIIVPIYNIVSVFILETFRGGHFYLPGILLGVLKNPMILGAILGAAFLILGIPIPKPVLKPIGQVAAATTPVALIILGASFKGGSFHNHLPQLVGCVLARLIIVPTIMLGLAIFLGFRGIELVTLVAIFATPCAVAGFAMAQQMNSDAELAGNCVVYTSALSCFTIFGWIFLLKTLSLF